MGRPPSNKKTIVCSFRIDQEILDKLNSVKPGDKSKTVNNALERYFRIKDSTEAELNTLIEECNERILYHSNLKDSYEKQLIFHKDNAQKELEEKQKLKQIEHDKKLKQIERIKLIKTQVSRETYSKENSVFSLLNRTFNLKGIKTGSQALDIRKQFLDDKITPEILDQLEGDGNE